MQRRPVVSSHLRAVGYDARHQILEIEFDGGSVYHYFDVPEEVHDALMNAASKGAYFQDRIKDEYRHEKVD